MEIIIYGLQKDYNTVLACMDALPELQYRRIDCSHTENYDDFLHLLHTKRYDMVIVLADGAEGMEGVIASQTLSPDTMKVWISNDEGFGIQAHRMNCAYFAVKPITEEMVSKAYRVWQRTVGV